MIFKKKKAKEDATASDLLETGFRSSGMTDLEKERVALFLLLAGFEDEFSKNFDVEPVLIRIAKENGWERKKHFGRRNCCPCLRRVRLQKPQSA